MAGHVGRQDLTSPSYKVSSVQLERDIPCDKTDTERSNNYNFLIDISQTTVLHPQHQDCGTELIEVTELLMYDV